MKERFREFYEEHKEAIFTACVFAATYVTAVTLIKRDADVRIRQAFEGGVIETIEPLMRSDGVAVTLAHARDGRTYRFERNQ